MNDRLQIYYQRYICELCGARSAKPGECAQCVGVRLRDLADPAVRSWMRSQDASRRSQRLRSILVASAAGALAVVFILRELKLLPAPPEVIWAVSAAALGLVLGQIFRAPQLAPSLTDTEERWLRAANESEKEMRLPSVAQS